MAEIHFHALAPARPRSGEDPLVPFLLGARGAPVTVSMRDVPRLDSARLQLILAAQRQWAIDDVAFHVTDMAPSFEQGLERLGVDAKQFDTEVPQ